MTAPTLTLNPPVLRDITTIHPYPNNAKKHSDKDTAKLVQAIKRFGWRGNPILVDKDGVIISGHGRRLACLQLGIKKVPVAVEADLSAAEARAFRLADNRVAMTDFDGDLLEMELSEFPELTSDLDGIFDKKEMQFAIDDLMEVTDGVFEDSLTDVLKEQQDIADERINNAIEKRVSLAKLLGFKSVNGNEAIFVTRFMAMIEAETGKAAEEAFVEFARQRSGLKND